MLVRILPVQTSDYWDLIKGDIAASMPPIADWGPYDPNQVLYALMVGAMHLWVFTDKEQTPKGFITTSILKDVSGVGTLMIYNVIVVKNDAKGDWEADYKTLKDFALSRGCAKIGAFVANRKILDLLEAQDFDTRFVFVHKNL
mgnify:CR=1 FL=1|jgi:hypothetical protein